jgi:ABC-type branched-subunit amino acid transport system ATPase component/branched-subunit amino acid ABC-type transport system permease component
MDQVLLFAAIGLGSGVLYAAIALGIVVGYQGSGVVNFAAGAMGAFAAYEYDELRRTGDLVLPVVIVPERVSLGDAVPTIPALVLAVAVAALIGALAHVLVFDPLRRAPVLAKVVGSVGLMLTIQALVVLHFSSNARRVEPIVPAQAVRIAGQAVPRDRLWLAAGVLAVAAVLTLLFRTRIGLAIRAGAHSEHAVGLAGYSPRRLAATAWIVASSVVGFLAVLVSPTTILTPSQFGLAVVPALAAALIGRFSRLWVTAVAGLSIGAVQSVLQFWTTRSWWPGWGRSGAVDALPFLIVVAALFAVGHRVPLRGSAPADPLPEVRRRGSRPFGTLLAVAITGAVGLVVTSGGYRFGVVTSMIFAVIALSLVVLTGLVGQISLAQAAFAGTGGFVLAKVGPSLPFPVAPLAAALAAGALGAVVGLPALRIRGAQLAVVTLAMAVAIEQFVFRNPSITTAHGNRVDGPTLLGLDLSVRSGTNVARLQFGVMVLVVLLAACWLVGNLTRSGIGRRFLAVRSNERAAAAAGVDVARTKVLAFSIASFLAGLGGALLGYSRNQLSADSFTATVGISVLAFAYLGGITSVGGAVLAGLFVPLGVTFVVLDRWFDLSVETYSLLGGIGLVTTAIFNPVGIAQATADAVRRATRRVRPASDTPVAPAAATSATTATTARPGRVPARPPIGGVAFDVASLSVTYGGVVAVDRVDLTVHAGEIVGLIGPNGAGKTTFIDAVTGFVPAGGAVRLRGRDISALPPHRRAAAGLIRTWQSVELFDDLDVIENLQVAGERADWKHLALGVLFPRRRSEVRHEDRVLAQLGLSHAATRRPLELSLGQQKLVGVARALAADPAVLLLDEPAAGLDTAESAELGDRLRDIAATGPAILLVDHDMSLVLDVCDRVYVLDFGRMIASGPPTEIRSSSRVVEAYLGGGDARVAAVAGS